MKININKRVKKLELEFNSKKPKYIPNHVADNYIGLGFNIERSDRKSHIPLLLHGCTQYKNGVTTPNGKLFADTDEIARYCDPEEESNRHLIFVVMNDRNNLETTIKEVEDEN